MFPAYTLLEVLVVIGILLAVTMFVFPISLNQVNENKAKNASSNLTSLIFNIQQDAYARKNNQSQGVVFQSGSIIIYQGESLATAVSQETIEVPDDIYISSINLTNEANEINFGAGNFKPNNYGSVNISESGSTYQITINSEGLIYYHEV